MFQRLLSGIRPVSARRPRNRLSSPLQLESLEDRSMMAGVVSMTASPTGDISLRGDASSNNVHVAPHPLTHGMLIEGLDGTLIAFNGSIQATHVITPGDIPRDLRVDMGAGHDVVDIEFVSVGRDAIINLGAGRDDFRLEELQVGRNATIVAGTDIAGDIITLDDVMIGGNLTAQLGPAEPTRFDGLDIKDSTLFGDVVISNTTNTALIAVSGHILGSLNVQTGSGNDGMLLGGNERLTVFGSVVVNLGTGSDHLEFDYFAGYSNLGIDMGSGDDVVTFDRACTFYAPFVANLGAGNDLWALPAPSGYHLTFHSTVEVQGGTGTDSVDNQFTATYAVQPVFSSIERFYH